MTASTILVVDDEPQIRRVMRTTLSSNGLYGPGGQERGRSPRDDAERKAGARPIRRKYARHRRPGGLQQMQMNLTLRSSC